MSNISNDIYLNNLRVDKGNINYRTLIPILSQDEDFVSNLEQFREDTIDLGYDNEACRISQEIWKACYNNFDSEAELLEAMVKSIFEVDNFIGKSSHYGKFTWTIIETAFEFIVLIAYIM